MITDFGRNSFITWTAEDLRKEREAEIQMREIKFRGKRKDNNEWVYGYYVKVMDREGDEIDLICSIDISYPRINGKWYLEDTTEVIPETVGQSIIVEGKEFYEGDVTKDDTGDLGVVRFGKLPLDKSSDCVCTYPSFYLHCLGQLGQAPTCECQQLGEWMEIIGTIHTTHPELMEQGK